MKKITKKSGFTLVEIMIVVAIIGLLAAIGIPSFSRARSNSIEKAKENNVRIISSAIEQWAMETAQSESNSVVSASVVPYIKGGLPSLSVGTDDVTDADLNALKISDDLSITNFYSL